MAKILIVDDDLQLTNMLKLFLESEKYVVQIHTQGPEVQKALERGSYDVAVLGDLANINGLNMCRLYRQGGGTAPVLVLADRPDTGPDPGADDYLLKPFDPRELRARLKDLLKQTTATLFAKEPEAAPAAQVEPPPPNITAALLALSSRYSDIKPIGNGAMGLVFKATDKALARTVALKLLHPDLVPNSHSLVRFRQEAQSVAQLTHPNIVTIYDFGFTSNGVPFFVMEYCNGSSLDDVLFREHQIHPKQALKILKQVCDALVHAHGRGIIHRDIKPSNMMFQKIDPDQYVLKLLDFGIAKFCKQPTGPGQSRTRAGEIFGSPVYMSPEQAVGLPVDQRSDIFSTGYIFYECVTGIKLFLGDNDLDTMHKRTVEQPMPFSLVRPDLNLPKSLEAVVFKALSLQPKDRYQTASEMRWALDALSRTAGSILA